jgi:hypothetical protein
MRRSQKELVRRATKINKENQKMQGWYRDDLRANHKKQLKNELIDSKNVDYTKHMRWLDID